MEVLPRREADERLVKCLLVAENTTTWDRGFALDLQFWLDGAPTLTPKQRDKAMEILERKR